MDEHHEMHRRVIGVNEPRNLDQEKIDMETKKSYERRNEEGEWVSENSAALVEPIIIAGDESDIVVDMTDISGPTLGEPTSDTQWMVLQSIMAERERQDEQWGPVPRPDHEFGHWLAILMEELGEASNAHLGAVHHALGGDTHGAGLQEENVDAELTQAAAVLVAWLEHRAAIREQQRG